MPPNKQNKAKGKPGAPTKLTQELIDKLGAILQRGAYIETAVAAVGITHRDTFYRWMKIGASKNRGLHRALYDTVHRATAEAETNHLIVLDTAGKGVKGDVVRDKDGNVVLDRNDKPIIARAAKASDWKASAWFLERRFPKKWGAKQVLEHTGPDGGPIQNADIQMSEDDQKKLDKELEELRKANELTGGD